MRADRLLSILLLLQARGHLSAARLAEELEVSERTVYRDVEALGAAGVPIYGVSGPDGGYALVDDYRARLTGLTAEEGRALLVLSAPEPLARLGLGEALQGALRKLAAALPEGAVDEGARIRQRLHLDTTWWRQAAEPVPHLQTLYHAVWHDQRVRLRHALPPGPDVEFVADPYGLVAKAGDWYLVYGRGGGVRVHRVADLLDATPVDGRFQRPTDLDLPAFWAAWAERHEREESGFRVTVRVAEGTLRFLPWYLGARARDLVAQAPPPDAEGRVTLGLTYRSFDEARSRLLAWGGAAEVLDPPALRRAIQDYAEQIVALYTA